MGLDANQIIKKAYDSTNQALRIGPVGGAVDGALTLDQSALTYSASLTVNLANSNVFTLTLTGNVTTLTLSNPVAGGKYTFILTQDGTGSRTVAWPAAVKWPGGTAPTLGGASEIDVVTMLYDGTNYYADSALNFS